MRTTRSLSRQSLEVFVSLGLLALLASEPGSVVPRRRILREVWDTEWFGPTKTVDVHVASLRKKLGDPTWIETVRGVGLRLVPRP